MKTKSTFAMLAALALTGVAFGSVANAQQGPMGGPVAALDFASLDTNKDGKITSDELAAARTAEVTDADSDKDGKLSADELVAMHMSRAALMADTMAKSMITRFDADGDGMLTAAEMATRPAPSVDMFDTDGDGAVSQAELEAAQARMAQGGDHDGGHGGGHGRGHGRGHDGDKGGMWGWFSGN